MDLSWFSCEEFLPSFLVRAAICDLCRALFSPRVSRDSTKTVAIATIGCCSALCYRNSKARSTKEIRRIDNLPHSSPCCRGRLSVFVLRFSARSNFHPVQDLASPPFLRYPTFGRKNSFIFCSRSRFLYRLRVDTISRH